MVLSFFPSRISCDHQCTTYGKLYHYHYVYFCSLTPTCIVWEQTFRLLCYAACSPHQCTKTQNGQTNLYKTSPKKLQLFNNSKLGRNFVCTCIHHSHPLPGRCVQPVGDTQVTFSVQGVGGYNGSMWLLHWLNLSSSECLLSRDLNDRIVEDSKALQSIVLF